MYIYWAEDRDCLLHIAAKCVNLWIKQEVGILLTTRWSNNFKKKKRQLCVVSHWNGSNFNVNNKIMFVRTKCSVSLLTLAKVC